MKLKFITGALAVGLAVCAAQTPATPQSPPTAQTPPTAAGQTSGQNQTSDRDLTQKIRQALMDDKTLSTSAHNVKINCKDGKVTLKGNVTSDDEKQNVEQKATSIAGAGNVTDQLTVKAARAKKSS